MTAVLEVIGLDELTGSKLLEIYQNAYIDAQLDPDGDIRISLDGLKIFVSVDQGKKVMRLFTMFGAKPGTARQQLLELCNRINDGLLMIRATYPSALPTPALLLDHYVVTEAGLTGLEIVDETRRFRVVVGSVPPLDTEGILI